METVHVPEKVLFHLGHVQRPDLRATDIPDNGNRTLHRFQKLGDEFTRTQLLEEAVAMGIKENTALTWLKRLTKHGKLISMDGKGLYTRACVYE